ncbi:hypothetical protein ACFWP0_00910 [Achromobacter sp. NPDC058515]|uniref:hypothetical protein n=1 Tax=Achromobacter sp. NPDC058515 TaxID=3346533 RepID=UPI003651D3F4
MDKRLIKRIAIALCVGPLLWVLFLFYCRPVVALHYSARATESIGFFFMIDYATRKQGMEPGETVVIPTPMFPERDLWILLSFPFDSKDSFEIRKPFSRVDVCIGAGAKVERTEIRHGFFDRFTEPREPCEPPTSKR